MLLIPANLSEQLEREGKISIPIKYNSIDEPSQITGLRLKEMLDRWRKSIVASRLKRDQKTQSYTEPITVKSEDVATASEVGGNVWSRLFPFLLVMMSLTGAFYPAVDLCAGEKERGTMETLLISPASRAEIVAGKFLTIMLASVITALLNLVSMGLTGIQLANRFGGIALAPGRRPAISALTPPTLQAAFWMIVLLIPLAAFFSAVCLALAILARSMKEGQYYMTPLYLVCIPLVFLTLAPEIELNLFISLLPITGVALLLKALILEKYDVAARFFLPVMIPTLVYAAVALRWAVDQFQREEVLFREAEHFSVGSWLRHLFRDREPTPTGGQATLCFALMFSATWFLLQYLPDLGENADLLSVVAGQVVILIRAGCHGGSSDLFAPADAPARVARGALSRAGRCACDRAQSAHERAAPARRVAFSDLDGGQGVAGQDHGPGSECGGRCPGFCPDPRDLRGSRLSRVDSLRARAAAPDSLGDLAVSLDVWLPARLIEPVPAALQRDAPGNRARSLGGSEPKHPSRHRLSFLEQRLRGLLGYVVSSGRAGPILDWIYRNPADGLYHGGWIAASAIVSPLLLYYLWCPRIHRNKTAAHVGAGSVEATC